MRLQVLLRRLLSLLDLRTRTRKATWIVTKILIRVVIRMVTHIVLPSHLPARCGSAFLLLFLPSSIPVYPLPTRLPFFLPPGPLPLPLSHSPPPASGRTPPPFSTETRACGLRRRHRRRRRCLRRRPAHLRFWEVQAVAPAVIAAIASLKWLRLPL